MSGIQIKEPCSENWSQMSSVAQGRFCNSCSKIVYDVSGWKKNDILKEFSMNDENLCIRIPNKQLAQQQMPSFSSFQKLYRWLIIIVVMLAFQVDNILGKSNDAIIPDSTDEDDLQKFKASGIVLDSANNRTPLAYAVVVISTQNGVLGGGITDSDGKFSIEVDLSRSDSIDEVEIECSYLGYATFTKTVDIKDTAQMDVFMKEETIGLRKVVINMREKTTVIMGGMMMGAVSRSAPLYLLKPYDTKTYTQKDLQKYNLNRP